MPAAFVRVSQQECTPGSTGTYVDIDMDSYGIEADAVGVWLLFLSSSTLLYDARKNGSTDTIGYGTKYLTSGYQSLMYVGIDANGIAEIKVSSATLMDAYCLGSMVPPVTMFTNAVDKSAGAVGSIYHDVDVSTECPDATMCLISLLTDSTTPTLHFLRKNGSSDNRMPNTVRAFGRGHVVGLDASQFFEQKIGATTNDCYVQGYYAGSAVTMHTNATDRSLGSTGSWIDLTALASGAFAGFYSVHNLSATPYNFGLRKNGTADDPYLGDLRGVCWQGWIAECDGSQLVEGKIENVSADFYELGYAEGEGASAFPQVIIST